jgi:hypothetical protein
MNEKLIENNYLIIPNFISSYRASCLKNEFIEYTKEHNITGDSQVKLSKSSYNYISFLELLCEKTPEVSEILKDTVLPTYAYSRVYVNGSVLEKHVDADPCEISLTVHLGGDKSWPIWITTPQGEDRSIDLKPGDAMVYLGRIAEHWRNEYLGEEYAQVFLHYVRSRGDCSYSYFDKCEQSQTKIDKDLQEHNNIEIKKNIIEENEKEKSSIEIKTPIVPLSPLAKLEDFIYVFDDILSKEHCDLILNEYQNSDEWENSSIAGDESSENGLVSLDIRRCKRIPLSVDDVMQKNFFVRKKIDDILFSSVKDIIKRYENIFPTFGASIDTGYEILKYNEGDFYTIHTDSYKSNPRSLSCSIQLNEDYDGGEFAFFDRGVLVRAKTGSAIVFPSNFMFPHEIMPVIKGTRYSVITWLL